MPTSAPDLHARPLFPWVRHLTEGERQEFAGELFVTLSDGAHFPASANAREVIAGWRATARIKADDSDYERAIAATSGDFGAVSADS